MARRKYTPLQREYAKQVKRIKRYQNQLMSEGYSLFNQPDLTMPKRVTRQSIERLKDITPRRLRALAEIVVDGETLTAKEVKKRKIKLTPENVWNYVNEDQIARQITENFRDELKTFDGNLGNWLLVWFDGLVNKYGKRAVAKALQEMPQQFSDYYSAYAPDYGRAVEAFESDLINLLPGEESDIPDGLRSAIEEYEQWEEY